MIHIDGGHETSTVVNDFIYTQFLLKEDGIIIFDDYNYGNIKNVIDYYVEKNVISKYDVGIVNTNLHYVYKIW